MLAYPGPGRRPKAVPHPGAGAVLSERVAPSVLVIGAGVSGCACAATLASAGVRVTLINSAMDRVGLPAYGPDLMGPGGRWDRIEETMAALPSPLRAVWLEAGMRPVCGAAVMNIDRRRVSVETKRLLELVPGLQFRQGFVVDLRTSGCPDDRGRSVPGAGGDHLWGGVRSGRRGRGCRPESWRLKFGRRRHRGGRKIRRTSIGRAFWGAGSYGSRVPGGRPEGGFARRGSGFRRVERGDDGTSGTARAWAGRAQADRAYAEGACAGTKIRRRAP